MAQSTKHPIFSTINLEREIEEQFRNRPPVREVQPADVAPPTVHAPAFRCRIPQMTGGSASALELSRPARAIAVGTAIAGRPPHRSGLAQLRHPAPTSGV